MPVYAVTDSDKPFSATEREVITLAFQVLEETYGGNLWLMVYRQDDGNLILQEPRSSRPDFDRVCDKVAELGNFLIDIRGEARR